MAVWVRFEHKSVMHMGTLQDNHIAVYAGDLFNNPSQTPENLLLSEVKLLTPTTPSKMIGLWNNSRSLAEKQQLAIPAEPLYFIKSSSCFLAHGDSIRQPIAYSGRVIFEAELGIVIGKKCKEVSEIEATNYIFGYTCVNDVTALELINKDSTFAQWTRAKNFDTFGVFGPVVRTDIDPDTLVIKAFLNGRERQSYPVTDLIFSPQQLVSKISQDMTLLPGDIIACGTSLGVAPMKSGSTIEVCIENIGTLKNTFE